MSNLRIFGCIVGILGLAVTFVVYRGQRWKKSNFILLSLFNVSLFLVSLNPDLLNALRDALALREVYRGRILALLIVSNIFLLFYILVIKIRFEWLHLQFDRLVRALGAGEIERSVELASQIKPIMVLIPAYNEAENLREVLPQIPERIDGMEIGALVVDDGSDDDTFRTATNLRRVWVARNPINRGGGAALRLGYDILQKAGARICVTMDADGQHKPQEIRNLVTPIVDDQFDCVIGSRILGSREKGSALRIAGVYIFGRVISTLLGKKITDPSSGFRAFKMKALERINLREDQYHTSELIIEAVRKGVRITEVPITILKRQHGKSKKGKDLLYGFHFARIILKTWWR